MRPDKEGVQSAAHLCSILLGDGHALHGVPRGWHPTQHLPASGRHHEGHRWHMRVAVAWHAGHAGHAGQLRAVGEQSGRPHVCCRGHQNALGLLLCTGQVSLMERRVPRVLPAVRGVCCAQMTGPLTKTRHPGIKCLVPGQAGQARCSSCHTLRRASQAWLGFCASAVGTWCGLLGCSTMRPLAACPVPSKGTGGCPSGRATTLLEPRCCRACALSALREGTRDLQSMIRQLCACQHSVRCWAQDVAGLACTAATARPPRAAH